MSHRKLVETELGLLQLEGNADSLTAIRWPGHTGYDPEVNDNTNHVLDEAARQLIDYLAGKRQLFELPLAPVGTDFQQQVWSKLQSIPFGATSSYGDLAKSAGKPGGARAFGAAIGRNPLAIVIPCHRVVGSTGKLTGFAGGIDRKQWLLQHETRQ